MSDFDWDNPVFTRRTEGIFSWVISNWPRTGTGRVMVSGELARDVGWRGSDKLCLGPHRLRIWYHDFDRDTLHCWRESDVAEEWIRSKLYFFQNIYESIKIAFLRWLAND